jgi:PAS domain S-box-containing protein
MTAAATGRARLSGRLARRVAALIGVGGLLAFALIAALLVVREVQRLEQDAAAAARAAVQAIQVPLAQAAWDLDRSTLALLLKPLADTGSIVELRVVDGQSELARHQREGADTLITDPAAALTRWSLPLPSPTDPERRAAVLEVTESYQALRQGLWQRLPLLLLLEALKLALVAALVLALLHRHITRPLHRLADDVDALGLATPAAALTLERPRRYGMGAASRGDELDRLVGAINALHDRLLRELAERSQAEARERDEASQRSLILGLVGDGVLAFDRRGMPLYANAAAEELLDLTGEMTDALRRQAGPEREAWHARFAEVHAQCKRTGEPAAQRTSHPVRRRDGRVVPADFMIQALPRGPLGYIVTVRDQSAEQETQRALAESRAARAADQAKSEFLSRISHELRTPLNAVLGLADVLRAGAAGPVSDRQHELLGVLRNAGSHLLALIGDLLELSRIEAGELRMLLQAQPLQPLLQEVGELVQPGAASRGVALRVEVDAAAAGSAAAVDSTRLRQVLLNLLSNAVKYNRAGGWVALRLVRQDEVLRIEVEDNGLGMSEAQQAQIFRPFARAGRESSGIEGTGIGLVIARHLVERMGGVLGCRSAEDCGSCFSVTLPRVPLPKAEEPMPAPAGAGAPARPAGAAPRAARVLVVEDDEVNRLLLRLYLQQRPELVVVQAASSAEALALAAAGPEPFALALLDMHLGADSGLQLRAALATHWQEAGVALPRFVAYSADPGAEAQRQALAAGFDAYWVKPMGLDEFLARLDGLLAGVA